uniref:F-box protein Hrt3/FBXO9 C-terminal domain-containing protein n=1 Tax=Phaeomonas parva TaxID=124430 RepID=A0A6U4L306_9STRA|mmetsp:Transcript_45264/g.141884  ORF Transcript_45264/g.141884 Transcript_45264/m.141884 type:complete len:227 (+) Transcript_45264:398-1078(+)
MRYLESDMYGVISCCSLDLRRLGGDEVLFRQLCELTYAVQSRRGKLRVERWGHSWRNMYVNRPRMRVNGLYFQRVSYIKRPERNMWYDGEAGNILECIYYRYLRFFRTGEVLYGISLQPPKQAAVLLTDVSSADVHQDVSVGEFEVLPGRRVQVSVRTDHGRVVLDLDIDNGERGSFTRLKLNSHLQFPYSSNTGEARELPILANVFKYRRLPIRTKPKFGYGRHI